MAIELPAAQKVYTTVYDNFKGVDFTNDATNVWRRRSPSAVNMLPDASGRPFKRNGWYVLLSKEDICDAFSAFSYVAMQDYTQVEITADEFEVDKQRYYTESGGVYTQCDEGSQYDENETYYILTFSEDIFNENKSEYYTESGGVYTQCGDESVYDENETYYRRVYSDMKINKCSYFEIAGEDHIVIFTTLGVLFYKNGEDGEGEITATNTDEDCYTGYDRCFFFEGNGTSAFYIYGNYKVWRYESDFALHDVTSQITIPTVLAGANAECTGTTLQGYNMLGNKAAVEYNDVTLKYGWCSDGLTIDTSNITNLTQGNWYQWTWNGSSWTKNQGTVEFANSGIQIASGTKKTGDIVIFVYGKGVLIPKNITQSQVQSGDIKVYTSRNAQFDCALTVTYSSTPSVGSCTAVTDPLDKHAFILFSNSEVLSPKVDGQDFVKVVFPSISVITTAVDGTHPDDPSDPSIVDPLCGKDVGSSYKATVVGV